MDIRHRTVAISGLVLGAFLLGVIRASGWDAGWGFKLPEPPVVQKAVEPIYKKNARKIIARYESHFASSRLHTQVHAASLVELNNGDLRAFWFSGSREGAPDVTINSAVFDSARKTWGEEQVVTGRATTQRGLRRYIAKVGNPVAARGPDGDLWLFYVTVSLGGWAGSSITLITSNDEGKSWSAPRRLVTSPFINVSTLVKAPPFMYADGTLGLPVYHEFISKFAEVLRLDRHGKVLDKQRLAAGGQGTLQPVVLVENEKEALALTRYAGKGERRVMGIATHDGGRHWETPAPLELRNPNAALTAITLPGGGLLAVLNDREQGRESLGLHVSEDGGKSWRELHRLEEMGALHGKTLDEAACLDLVEHLVRGSDARLERATQTRINEYVTSAAARVRAGGGCGFEFSYPWLMQAKNGDIHLAYTWNRTFIKHLVLDPVWLESRMNAR